MPLTRMPRLLRWFLGAALVLVVLVLLAVGAVYVLSERPLRQTARVIVPPFAVPLPTDSASLAEGQRLAFTRGCTGCHGDRLEGRVLFSEPLVATVPAPNLSALARVANDAELERAIRHGIGRDGRALFAMPSNMYRVLTDQDLARLLGWLRAQPEQTDSLPARSIGPLGRLGFSRQIHPARYYIETDTIPAPPEDPALRAGHYIAWSSCTECHGGALQGDEGTPALGPIATAYSLAEMEEFFRTGLARGGRELSMSAIARDRLSHLRPDEVASLHAISVAQPLMALGLTFENEKVTPNACRKLGSQIQGRVLGTRLGGPSVKTRNETGVESAATATMFASSARPSTFHPSRSARGGRPPLSSQMPSTSPVMPVMMSKLRRSSHLPGTTPSR
jgi:mono/diheme cytochrome c family protein